MKLEAQTINGGSWIKIQIVSVTEGFTQTLENGKWVNTTEEPQVFKDVLLTLGNLFSTFYEAEQFMKTKQFKSLYKCLEKNWA